MQASEQAITVLRDLILPVFDMGPPLPELTGEMSRRNGSAGAQATRMDVTVPDPQDGAAFGGSLGWGRQSALLLVDLMAAYFTRTVRWISGPPMRWKLLRRC